MDAAFRLKMHCHGDSASAFDPYCTRLHLFFFKLIFCTWLGLNVCRNLFSDVYLYIYFILFVGYHFIHI
jgi:hypothetical protein